METIALRFLVLAIRLEAILVTSGKNAPVARPGAPSSFLLLVVRPGAPGSFLLPAVRPGAPGGFLLLAVRPGDPSSFVCYYIF